MSQKERYTMSAILIQKAGLIMELRICEVDDGYTRLTLDGEVYWENDTYYLPQALLSILGMAGVTVIEDPHVWTE